VLDTDWHPFNDRIIASASDDGKVFVWEVPQNFTLYTDGDEVVDVTPVSKLTGHSRKVGQVLFNPAAENILASASGDLTIKLWDIGTGQANLALKHPDIVQSLSWSANCAFLVTTSRDKKLRVWDVRQQQPVHEYAGHEGAKNSRAVWMGEHNRIATTGFSRMSERQIALWEPGRKDPIGGFNSLDSISGICMPFWDDGSNMLYLAGKGDGNIRYFEYENDKFEFLSEHKSADPQRGIAFLPRRGINVHENEIMRAFKTINDTWIEPISFTVPRRAETFQSDIYPPAVGLKPAMSAKEWLDGKTGVPAKIDLESIYEGSAPVEIPADFKPAAAPVRAPVAAPAPAPKKEPEPAPAAVYRAPPTAAEQKASISTMANKYQDDEESSDDEAETSSFEEISRPAPRAAPAAVRTPVTAAPPAQVKPPSPIKTTSPALSRTTLGDAPKSSSSSDSGLLDKIKDLFDHQNKLIGAQSEKIAAQSHLISQLATDVEALKKRVGSGSQEQSERIRQLELELEEARS